MLKIALRYVTAFEIFIYSRACKFHADFLSFCQKSWQSAFYFGRDIGNAVAALA